MGLLLRARCPKNLFGAILVVRVSITFTSQGFWLIGLARGQPLKCSHAVMDLEAENTMLREKLKKMRGKGTASEEADEASTFSIFLDLVDH